MSEILLEPGDTHTEVAARSIEDGGVGIQPAPSSSIAQACRRFGDDYPPLGNNWRVRSSSVLLMFTACVYVPWMIAHLNIGAPWVSGPFLAANVLTLVSVFLTSANSWHRSVPERKTLAEGGEPHVAVIIPTCGESIPMILRTIASVTEQNWPADKLTVIVSDDGHDSGLEAAVTAIGVLYHSPPPRWAPGRDGAAKAGNLNSALAMIDADFPSIEFIETRDADDEVGSNNFLREVMGQLVADERLAYVQTIKEAQVSAGDPFNNRESMFYRNQMLSKNAANAVFPCGSGVVWRRVALRDIGDFPVWNLVEDLQSGFEALRRGWKSMYVPIVGAVGQHAPEDVPNVFKQRGTWALDTVRLMLWADSKGLSKRQFAHFAMLLLYYLTSFSVLTYFYCIIASLMGTSPVNDNSLVALAFILPFAFANEIWLLASNYPYNDRRKQQRHQFRDVWRARVLWTGMSTVFAKAIILAVLGGRNKKPTYKVTRKEHDLRWHWRETLPHIILLASAMVLFVYAVVARTLTNIGQITVTLYFGSTYFGLLAGFVNRGRHGVKILRLPTVERRWPFVGQKLG